MGKIIALEEYLSPTLDALALEVAFTRFITESPLPIFADFYAEWCAPCLQMMPVLAQLAEQKGTVLRVVKVDVNKFTPLITKYPVGGVPTLMLFDKGKMIWNRPGICSLAEMQGILKEQLSL